MVRLSDGTLKILVDEQSLYDVSDPCVSWDARKILFAGILHPDSSWRLFEVDADGKNLRQLTFSNRSIHLNQFGMAAQQLRMYDDFDPCYLPDGRIVFASTRYPSLASYDQLLTSNLFVMNPDGTDIKRITTERNGGEEPTIDPLSGEVVYARWWVNRDRPSNVARHGVTRNSAQALTDDVANIWQAISIRSDGAGMKLYAGFPRTREGTHTYKPAVMSDGTLLSTFSPNTSLSTSTAGAGIRWFRKGADTAHHIIGTESFQDSKVTVYATDPIGLDSSRILFAYSSGDLDFSLAIASLDGKNFMVLENLPGTNELEPQPLIARRIPPVLEEEFPYTTNELPPTEDPRTHLQNDTFRFDCLNIFTNGAVDEPMPSAPRISVGARIRFFMNVQRQNSTFPDPSIFLRESEVHLNGSVHEHDLPADVPLFEQVVDLQGRVLETPDRRFAHVTGMNFDRMGSGTKCVGCHAGHSMLTVPINASLAEWFNVSPSATITASSTGLLPEGSLSWPFRVADRQARTGSDTVNWVAHEEPNPSIHLRWDIPVEVREVLLYGIRDDEARGTKTTVHDCRILLYYKSELVGSVDSSGEVLSGGTSVKLVRADVDLVTIQILSFSGLVHGRPRSGLAEVEIIARISRLNFSSNSEG
jgi:hypothetical protein